DPQLAARRRSSTAGSVRRARARSRTRGRDRDRGGGAAGARGRNVGGPSLRWPHLVAQVRPPARGRADDRAGPDLGAEPAAVGAELMGSLRDRLWAALDHHFRSSADIAARAGVDATSAAPALGWMRQRGAVEACQEGTRT